MFSEYLENRTLPPHFDTWDFAKRTGTGYVSGASEDFTVAAAALGILPKDFNQWEVKDTLGTSIAHIAARNGTLPKCFSGWAKTYGGRCTVAETAFQYHKIPDDFLYWDTMTKRGGPLFHSGYERGLFSSHDQLVRVLTHSGDTGYHLGAKFGCLTYNQVKDNLLLANHYGNTVAHYYSSYKKLKPNFKHWDVKNIYGYSIAHVAALYRTLPARFDRWDIKDNLGVSVAHVAAKLGNLPSDFDRWDLADGTGWTVAHEAATRGCLPSDFDQWDLADGTGWTVAHAYHFS